MRRNIRVFLLFAALFALIPSLPLSAAVYEASTLHNAVSRSETVLDLFYERWERIQDMELYFDWYGKINWVDDFKVNAVNAGTGQRQAVPMTLVRAYGSVTLNFPLLGGYEGADMQQRLKYGTGKYRDAQKSSGQPSMRKPGDQGIDASSAQGEQASESYWKPRNLILGFTATGFHYGLTRKGEIDRGTAGNEEFTDYKYTQFFDDIFAVSLLYRPYFYIHGGVIVNRQIEPNNDGTMDYDNTSDMTKRYFVASNLLSFLNVNSTVRSSELETLAVGVIINQILGIVSDNIAHTRAWRLTLTYKQVRLYNDQPYDPVWVNSAYIFGTTPKTAFITDDERDQAKLHTLAVELGGDLGQILYYSFFGEFQRPDKTLVDRQTNQEIDYSPLREFRAVLGYNFLSSRIQQGEMFIASVGVSRFWDPAIPIHRENGEGYALWGGTFMLEGRMFVYGIPLGFGMNVSRNYSRELRRLVEVADKWVLEGSLNVSF